MPLLTVTALAITLAEGATVMKKHLLQAAERGNAEAQFNLEIMYENDWRIAATSPKAADPRL